MRFINEILHRVFGLRVNRLVLFQTLKLLFDIRKYFLLGRNQMIAMDGATTFGSLWQPISLGTIVFGVGFTFSTLFQMDAKSYVPFFCVSVTLWMCLSASLNELSASFCKAGSYQHFEYHKLVLFPITIISKFAYILTLNQTVFVAVCLIFKLEFSFLQLILSILSFLIFILICFFIGIIFSIIGSRYSDFPNVVQNVIQLMFYVTPVMWKPESMKHKWVFEYNPFYYLLELVRRPMLGLDIDVHLYIYGLITLVVLFVFSLLIWSIFSWRINYHSK